MFDLQITCSFLLIFVNELLNQNIFVCHDNWFFAIWTFFQFVQPLINACLAESMHARYYCKWYTHYFQAYRACHFFRNVGIRWACHLFPQLHFSHHLLNVSQLLIQLFKFRVIDHFSRMRLLWKLILIYLLGYHCCRKRQILRDFLFNHLRLKGRMKVQLHFLISIFEVGLPDLV